MARVRAVKSDLMALMLTRVPSAWIRTSSVRLMRAIMTSSGVGEGVNGVEGDSSGPRTKVTPESAVGERISACNKRIQTKHNRVRTGEGRERTVANDQFKQSNDGNL